MRICAAVPHQGCSQIVLGRKMRDSKMNCTALPLRVKTRWKVLRVFFTKVSIRFWSVQADVSNIVWGSSLEVRTRWKQGTKHTSFAGFGVHQRMDGPCQVCTCSTEIRKFTAQCAKSNKILGLYDSWFSWWQGLMLPTLYMHTLVGTTFQHIPCRLGDNLMKQQPFWQGIKKAWTHWPTCTHHWRPIEWSKGDITGWWSEFSLTLSLSSLYLFLLDTSHITES